MVMGFDYSCCLGSPPVNGEAVEDGDGNGVAGTQERHHKLPERTLSWDTNYDKEGSFNHIPLLTAGRSVS